MESAIRLFKALPVETKQSQTNEDLLRLTISKGFIFTPDIVYTYPDTDRIIALVDKVYGRSSEQLNQSFHKSWSRVRDAALEQLVLEQIVHYITTYGFEQAGIYDKDSVSIPHEQLDAPELQDDLRLVVIRGYTREELKAKLLELLGAGVALQKSTIDDVLDVAGFVGLTDEEIDRVRNKEVQAALYASLGIVPGNPTKFLRFVVSQATGKTLLIKNKALVAEIKGRDNADLSIYFDQYESAFGFARLAEIFYRFKPLFLAFRTNEKLKQTINRLRRLARTHHKPLAEDQLNTVTARLRHEQPVLTDQFQTILQQASVFRKIRLAYALKFRTVESDSILYRVRNGKSYAQDFAFTNQAGAQAAFAVVMQAVIEDVTQNVSGKKIFIPRGVKYGLPATEKQFTGNLPSGTYVEITEDMVAGIHWENQGSNRVDLDLSLLSPEVGKIGWNGSYRTSDRSILFSGDMTDAPAPQGASELFYISQEARGVFILFVNYFNFHPATEIPFKIVVAHEKPVDPTTHYTLDPNTIVALSNTTIKVKQKNLGILVADEASCKFYFAESDLGSARSAHGAAYAEQARKYLLKYYTDAIVLNDVLVAAGAELVQTADEADIDLSPERLDKTTILNLLQAKA